MIYSPNQDTFESERDAVNDYTRATGINWTISGKLGHMVTLYTENYKTLEGQRAFFLPISHVLSIFLTPYLA